MKTKATTLADYQTRMRKAYVWISEPIDEPVDIETLAREVAFSFYHFHRVYRSIIGETVADTHRRLRLERAARQLLDTHISVTQIALDAGYETPQAFTRAFKMKFNHSPLSYRKTEYVSRLLLPPAEFCPSPLKTGIDLDMNITIETRPATTVFGIQYVGEYSKISAVFTELMQWIAENNLISQINNVLGVYYDDSVVVPAEKCRSDVCVSLKPPYPKESSRIKRMEIPAGTYLRYRHVGPYYQLSAIYENICGRWMPEHNFALADQPPFEVYLNNPCEVPEDELITDINFRIVSN